MIYRLTTGWYPSANTAYKVLGKVKAVEKNASVKECGGYFTVEIKTFTSLDIAVLEKERFIKKGICCGVECLK